jgi:hypothetical protein
MDLIKAKTILSRLQAMQQSLEQNSQLSSLEKDLILDYLRELYTIYQGAEVLTPSLVKTLNPTVAEKAENKEMGQKTLEFKFQPEISEPKDMPGLTTTELFQPIAQQEPQSTSQIEAIPGPEPVSVSPAIPIPASILELFQIRRSMELTDKLNELPLRDIHRALGLNDKIEYTSILFGNQKALFDQVLGELNQFKHFDEAQSLLGLGPAIHFKWDHEDRREKAMEFIRLIRRRYL